MFLNTTRVQIKSAKHGTGFEQRNSRKPQETTKTQKEPHKVRRSLLNKPTKSLQKKPKKCGFQHLIDFWLQTSKN